MHLWDLRGMGLVEVLKCTVKDFMDDEMPTYASALAFQMLFSLFPFLLFLIALIGFLDLQKFFDWLQQQAALLLPPQAMDTVNTVIAQFQQERVGLFSVGIVVALWTASAGVRSTMQAMNKAYDVKEGRPAWKRIPLSVLYTVGIALMLLSAAALMLVGPEVMSWLAGWVGLEQLIVTLWTWLRWPVAILLLILAVAVIYYVAPDAEQSFRFITPGSVLAVLVWIAASLGFGFYVRNFANYDATYGSVGAIIVMLLYFFISAAVLLFGAELNAVIEHHHPEGKDPGEKKL
ncbi:YihY/virulence factor BrkB family protein [Azotobacter salinestris]|uniref:YihY/virulence factor BrkB family protein n=1 Tax=Azotobacter salinestris TaxID=69964 RepID=UPI001266ACD0|nr:YihY/virulence factor BrkB family protein [Azotobacter salinestris]